MIVNMTFDDWYEQEKERILTGRMTEREIAAAAWYGAMKYCSEASIHYAENHEFFDGGYDVGKKIATWSLQEMARTWRKYMDTK